ncbi:MAG: hypothetical protein ACPGU7_12730 [Gammaproteobacteria bacterium]
MFFRALFQPAFRHYPQHWAMEAVFRAAQEQGHPIRMASYGDHHEALGYAYLSSRPRQLLDPWVFVARMAFDRRGETVLLRESNLVLLAATVPFLLLFRSRLILGLHHNVQRAHQRWRDRAALWLLGRLGFRFFVQEDTAGMESILGERLHTQVLSLPHALPTTPLSSTAKARHAGPPVLGVVGTMRPEKGNLELLDRLIEMRDGLGNEGGFELLVGCPEGAPLEQARRRGCTVVDTTDKADYQRAIAACDVLVFNFQAADYHYRCSGTIAEAIAQNVLVVAPDFPLIRHQVMWPAPAGACFSSLDALPEAIETALGLLADRESRCAAHRSQRDPGRHTEQLRRFIGC